MTRADAGLVLAELSRRSLFGGAAAVGGLAVLSTLAGAPLSAKATGTPPLTAADAAQLAIGLSNGRTFASLKTDPITESPWSGYNYKWCAWFVSWILRGTNVKPQWGAESLFRQMPIVSSPAVGDMVWYDDNPDHVELVVGLNNGHVNVVGGNTGSLDYTVAVTKWRADPFAAHQFSRPTFPGGTNGSQGDDDMKLVNLNSVDYLIGAEFIFASPDPATTNMMTSLYGSSHVLNGAGEMNLCCRPLGIPDGTYARLSGGQAWSSDRGVFLASDPYAGH